MKAADILTHLQGLSAASRLVVRMDGRDKELTHSDRMALEALQLLTERFPTATNGEVQEALVNALWWHLEIASSKPPEEEKPALTLDLVRDAVESETGSANMAYRVVSLIEAHLKADWQPQTSSPYTREEE